MEDIGPDQLRIRELIARIKKNGVTEVILAMNPTTEGEATIHYLGEQLKPLGLRVSLPARGLPLGAEIEFTDASILGEAIRKRSLADG